MYKICSCCNSRYEYGKECSCDGMKQAKQKQQKYYDKHVRKSKDNLKYDRFYHSKEWERLTNHIKNKYNGLCLMCLVEEGKPIPYDVIHHILEIKTREGWEHRLDEEKVISLCHECHNRLHSHYTQEKVERLVTIVNEYKELYEV